MRPGRSFARRRCDSAAAAPGLRAPAAIADVVAAVQDRGFSSGGRITPKLVGSWLQAAGESRPKKGTRMRNPPITSRTPKVLTVRVVERNWVS
mgnify:CR=1 FL=1